MKKHNEGYALVLVLVVLTVLSLVCMAMTAASLKNLKNQQDSIERTQAKYAAQGEIEKVIAQLAERLKTDENVVNTPKKINQADVTGMCTDTAVTAKLESVSSLEATEQFDRYLKLELTAKKSNMTVVCTIRISGNITDENLVAGGSSTSYYAVSNPKWEYVSYTITEGGGEG